jgi:hypothetical protein
VAAETANFTVNSCLLLLLLLLLLLPQVDIGVMQVDYSSLVWQQKVRMKNVPAGRVRIHLSGKDMGNFVSHPLFQAAAATAVHVSTEDFSHK